MVYIQGRVCKWERARVQTFTWFAPVGTSIRFTSVQDHVHYTNTNNGPASTPLAKAKTLISHFTLLQLFRNTLLQFTKADSVQPIPISRTWSATSSALSNHWLRCGIAFFFCFCVIISSEERKEESSLAELAGCADIFQVLWLCTGFNVLHLRVGQQDS